MNALLVLTGLSFLLCMIFTPLVRDLAMHFGIVDCPDLQRKLHIRAVPRVGGIPIILSYAGAVLLMVIFAPHWVELTVQHRRLILELCPAVAVIFLTGLLDDLVCLRPWQKLSGQILAAALAVLCGQTISLASSHPGALLITIPLSMMWLIGCTNAFNLIDGMDGLASGVGLFATLTTAAVGLIQGDMGLAMATAPLAGCLLAFLRYNFNPASVFLGDSGSLTIGFMMGCFSLIWGQHSGNLLGLAAPTMVMALPLLDVALAIMRRGLRRKPIFQGDRGHIHHMILARGLRTRDAALVLYGVCTICAVLAVLQTLTRFHMRALVILLFLTLIGIGINALGYVELAAARQTGYRFVRHLRDEIFLQDLTNSLAKAKSEDDCWEIVHDMCRDLSFASVQMRLNEHTYQAEFLPSVDDVAPWQLTIDLGRNGQLRLTRLQHRGSPPQLFAALEKLQQAVMADHMVFTKPQPILQETSSLTVTNIM
jgi:UDP-GlcNAc:undecaprenyl-phosphate/decaprenyl-phosphate GlcNAc-1-phosphate transferase